MFCWSGFRLREAFAGDQDSGAGGRWPSAVTPGWPSQRVAGAPQSTHSSGLIWSERTALICSRRGLGWVFGTSQPNAVGRWVLSCQKWPGFESGRVAASPTAVSAPPRVDLTQQWAGVLAKRRQVASDTRRFHPAGMHALHMGVAAVQPSRLLVGQHDLHLFGASSGGTAMNRPADPLARGAAVDELLDRRQLWPTAFLPRPEVPTAPAVSK